MASQNIAPKADQPLVRTENLKRGEKPAGLEYRVTNIQSYGRSPKTRTMGRQVRG